MLTFPPEVVENGVTRYYKHAMNVAEANLIETHPTRLGLALNFTVCYWEILKEPMKACELIQKSYGAANGKLVSLDEASNEDSTLIMQLLKHNFALWTSTGYHDDRRCQSAPRTGGQSAIPRMRPSDSFCVLID